MDETPFNQEEVVSNESHQSSILLGKDAVGLRRFDPFIPLSVCGSTLVPRTEPLFEDNEFH
jgi:hypothetical protein